MFKIPPDMTIEQYNQSLIKINLRLRKQNSALNARIGQMVYQQRYYMRTRGRSLKERLILQRQSSRNRNTLKTLRKLIALTKDSVGEGRYLMRLTRAEVLKLKTLLNLDLRKFNNVHGRGK